MQAPLVLITRPREQAAALCARLHEAGLRCECLPTLATEASPEATPPTPASQWDRLIFVSSAAVRFGWPMLQAADPAFAQRALAAVGPGSAQALRELGCKEVLAPDNGGAEALLRMDAMRAIGGRRVLILAAPGGRQVLQDTLTRRLARVRVLHCYRRVAPERGAGRIRDLIVSDPPVITQSSASGLRFMLKMVPKPSHARLFRLPLVVISQRLATLAQQVGFRHISSARSSTLDGFVEAICQTAERATRSSSHSE